MLCLIQHINTLRGIIDLAQNKKCMVYKNKTSLESNGVFLSESQTLPQELTDTSAAVALCLSKHKNKLISYSRTPHYVM